MVYVILSEYGIHHFYWSQIIHTTLQLFSCSLRISVKIEKPIKKRFFFSQRATYAYSARTAHPFQRNGAPFRFKLSKAQQVD